MRRITTFLFLGLGGIVTIVVGLSVDGWLHARDPTLAQREGIFTLRNPGHALLGLGLAVVGIALVGALHSALSIQGWGSAARRSGFLGLSAMLVIGTAGAGSWAATRGHNHGHGSGHATDEMAGPRIPVSDAHSDAHADEAHPPTTAPPKGAMTSDPKGVVAASASGHDHASGDASQVSTAQLAAAQKLVDDTRKGTEKYTTLEAAIADGYRLITPSFLPLGHYHNQGFHASPDILNPTAPDELIYANTGSGKKLVGAMFLTKSPFDKGPEIGGTLTRWHMHDNLCFSAKTFTIVALKGASGCPSDTFLYVTPWMLHVWLVDNPDGPFAQDMNPAAIQKAIGA
jgi:hypothetical protein